SRARHAWRRDLAFAQSGVEIARARAFAARLGASMVHLPRNLSAYRREWRRVRFERRRAATERGAVLGPFGGRHRTSRRCRPRPQPQHRHLALELRQKPWLCHSGRRPRTHAAYTAPTPTRPAHAARLPRLPALV